MKAFTIEVAEKYKARLRLWVKALRSGKYEQGKGTLLQQEQNNEYQVIDVGYCCLGVAEVVRGTSRKTILSTDVLTVKGAEYYGFFAGDSLVTETDPCIAKNLRASQANDQNKWSFKKIATAIERTYALNAKPKKRK